MSIEPPRMDLSKLAGDAYKQLAQLELLVAQHVDRHLLHLIKLRASQINGCAFCIAMHTSEALRDDEQPVRLTSLDSWDESPLYDDRERAALRWVEEITLIKDCRASTDAFAVLRRHFDPQEIAWLTMASALINTWNRVAIASRAQFPAPHPHAPAHSQPLGSAA